MGIRSRDAICNIDYQNLSGGYSPARIQPGKGAKSSFLTAPALIGTTISPGPTSWRPIPGLGHVLLATAWGGGLSNRSVLPRVRHDLGLFRSCRMCELHLPEHISGEKPEKTDPLGAGCLNGRDLGLPLEGTVEVISSLGREDICCAFCCCEIGEMALTFFPRKCDGFSGLTRS